MWLTLVVARFKWKWAWWQWITAWWPPGWLHYPSLLVTCLCRCTKQRKRGRWRWMRWAQSENWMSSYSRRVHRCRGRYWYCCRSIDINWRGDMGMSGIGLKSRKNLRFSWRSTVLITVVLAMCQRNWLNIQFTAASRATNWKTFHLSSFACSKNTMNASPIGRCRNGWLCTTSGRLDPSCSLH